MYYYICILFLCIPVYLCQTDGCFHETFEIENSSEISGLCTIISADRWIFETFSDTGIKPPQPFTSDGFIRVEGDGQNCLANQQPLNITHGSELIISYYASEGHITVIITDFLSDAFLDNGVFELTYNEWSTIRHTLTLNQNIRLNIIGISRYGNLMIDSVTYVDKSDQFELCAFGEDADGGNGSSEDGDSEDENGEDGGGDGGNESGGNGEGDGEDSEDENGEDGDGGNASSENRSDEDGDDKEDSEDDDGDGGNGEDEDGEDEDSGDEDGGGEDGGGNGEDEDSEDGDGDGDGGNGGGEDGGGEASENGNGDSENVDSGDGGDEDDDSAGKDSEDENGGDGDGGDGDGEDENSEDEDGNGGDGDGDGEDADGENENSEDEGNGEDGDGENGNGEDGNGEDGNGGDSNGGDGNGGDGNGGDGNGGDENGNGPNPDQPVVEPIDETDWLTIVIVLSVLSGVLLLVISASGCYFLGRSQNKNMRSYPYFGNEEGYVNMHLPRVQSQTATSAKDDSLPRYYVA